MEEKYEVGDFVVIGKNTGPFYKGQEVIIKRIYDDGMADVETTQEPLLVADKISLEEVTKIV